LLLLAAAGLCHAQTSPSAAQDGDPAQFLPQASSSSQSSQQASGNTANSGLPGIHAFAGSKITGIRFDGVKASMLGPLPSQLELQTGDTLTDEKVRASLKRLYDSGLYDTIQVQGLRSNGGVVVIFSGRPRLFIGRVQIFGIKNDRLQGRIAGSARLQPGTRYTQRKLDNSQSSIEQALTDNGFYQATVERREQLDAPDSQVNVIYNIHLGKQAKVGNVKVDGTPQNQQTEGRKQGESPDGEPRSHPAAQVLRQEATLGRVGHAEVKGVSPQHEPA
jgi:outer membrane protein assembly factor BamA